MENKETIDEQDVHAANLAALKSGQGVTVGAVYYVDLDTYRQAHGLDETAGGEASFSEIADALASFDPFVQFDDKGNVRAVLVGAWRLETDADKDENEILAITPEDWDASYQPKQDELTTRAEKAESELEAIKGKAISEWLPADLRERLVAIKGVGSALADLILAELTQ